MFLFHALVPLFSVALHQFPLLPTLLKLPFDQRLPPGRAENVNSHYFCRTTIFRWRDL